MKSDEEYYELEKIYLKLKDKYDDMYSEHIAVAISLNKNYEEALRQRNMSRNDYYKLAKEHQELKSFLDNPGRILSNLKISDIENYLRKKKLKKLQDE